MKELNTMKLFDAVMAYTAADEMSRQELPYGLALALCMVKKQTADQAGFFLEKEAELVQRYAQTDERGNIRLTENGGFVPQSQEGLEEYRRLHRELEETEIPMEPKRIRAKAPERIRPYHLMALEPFIEFEE